MFTLASVAGLVTMIPGAGVAVGGLAKALGWLLGCKPCLKVLGVALLCGWVALHVHRADVARCDARIEDDHVQAEAARKQRDASIATELGNAYQPKIAELAKARDALQERIKGYENRKPLAKAAVACKLGAAAGLLQPAPAR